MPRPSNRVFKKRVYWKKRSKLNGSEASSDVLSSPIVTPGPSNLKTIPATPTSSQKKLNPVKEKYDEVTNGTEQFEIIDLSILCEVFSNNVLCKGCAASGMELIVNKHVGVAAELKLVCKSCNHSVCFSSSTMSNSQDGKKLYSSNIRLVYGLRSIGRGKASGDMLCGIMICLLRLQNLMSIIIYWGLQLKI